MPSVISKVILGIGTALLVLFSFPLIYLETKNWILINFNLIYVLSLILIASGIFVIGVYLTIKSHDHYNPNPKKLLDRGRTLMLISQLSLFLAYLGISQFNLMFNPYVIGISILYIAGIILVITSFEKDENSLKLFISGNILLFIGFINIFSPITFILSPTFYLINGLIFFCCY